jgi:hypothetical protein
VPNLRPFLQFLLLCGFLVAGYVLIDAAHTKIDRERRRREQQRASLSAAARRGSYFTRR